VSALAELARQLREEESPIAPHVVGVDELDGPAGEYALVMEAVREGYLLHYGEPRVLVPKDPDLALLAGDRLYALGLAQLAAIGDLTAIAELADIIALSAQAHASGDAELAAASWEAGAAAIGWGTDPALAAAKERARASDPGAPAALRAAAAAARESAGS